jgi:serine/threonine-protein kinase
MGGVLKGRDPDLGRDVAIKVLRDDLRDDADMVRRFVEEAQIGGQLQHPGVVPIYELGTLADRRPFFAMKLVKGHTLAQLLEARNSPEDDRPRFLSIYEAVCQTVAYAHARGVIHRDLKPSNVMVGAFGEVQVMDWGLAKVLPKGGAADDEKAGQRSHQETVIATARSASGDADLSHAGSVLGTPSYMAPEQARGAIDCVDERADVFALGSILCEVLTGEPAFLGRSSAAILRKASLGDMAEAIDRLNACTADVDLIALAKDCLAAERDDRPRDARAVAEQITAYLASVQDKLRRAELERVEERARRRLTTLAAAALILFTVASGIGYGWIVRQRAERIARMVRVVDEALADAARLQGEAQASPAGETAKWDEALAAAKRADALLAQGEADAPLRNRVTALLSQLAQRRKDALERARQIELDRKLLARLESIRGGRADHWDSKRTDADYAAAFRAAGIDLDATDPVQAGQWIAARSGPVELASHLDDWAFVRSVMQRPASDWKRLVAAARAADPEPWRDALRGNVGIKDPKAAVELRRLASDGKALDAQPAQSLELLARLLKYGLRDSEKAARVLRRAAFRHPGDFWVRYHLALVYGQASASTPEAFSSPDEAVRHLSAAVALRPASSTAHDALGCAFKAQGKLDEAVAEHREAIRLQPDDPLPHGNLAYALEDQGKKEEAVAEYLAAVRLGPDLDIAHYNLGTSLGRQGKLDEASASLREAIRLNPADPDAHDSLGTVLSIQGRFDEAVAEFRTAIRIKPSGAPAHYSLGKALEVVGRVDAAAAEYREAIRLKPDFAWVHGNLGAILLTQGKFAEAAAEVREAIRLKPDDAFAHVGYNNLGAMLKAQHKLDEALRAFHESIRLNPRYAEAHGNIALILRGQGKLDEALVAYRRAVGLAQPGTPIARAMTDQIQQLKQQITLTKRLPALLKGDDKPKSAAEGVLFAGLCYDQGRYSAAARIWTETLAADPKLGDDRQAQHRYNAACAAARAAAGNGTDDHPKPDEGTRAQLRGQALNWQKAEQAAWAKVLDAGNPQAGPNVRQALEHWRADSDLAGVRDAMALAQLPEAERAAWRALWAEVDALLARARGDRP